MTTATVADRSIPVPTDTASTANAVRVNPVRAVRGLGVMVGGPLVLLAATVASAMHSVRALRHGRPPRSAAVVVLGTAAAYRRWALPWMRRWGATDTEATMTLPGDETVASPGARQTRAVQIDAPAHAVWPWIVQIGQDRGGFYSYEWLENLAGCRMTNADRIHPEWGLRTVGESVLLHPDSGLKVLQFVPGRMLVLESGWSFTLEPDGPESCRLLTRFIAPTGVAGIAYAMLVELPHFIMERKMLLEIKRRVMSSDGRHLPAGATA
ncbi:MAG: hypothetical protein QOI64_1510 [Solirubrobacteraceae bacterium]|jgi:hypothetical protein|nr:hypothetical protein [Solirubrobacteraceae bacterium]